MEIRLPTKAELAGKFTLRKAPGWLLSVIGFVTFLRWLLDLKGTIEEAISTAGEVSSTIQFISPLVISPWFGIALVIAGIGYGIFVPTTDHPTPRAEIAIFVAWSALILCFLAVWTVLEAAFIAVGPRALDSRARARFTKTLAGAATTGVEIKIVAFGNCNECMTYAWDFAEAMNGIPKWPKHVVVPVEPESGINQRLRGVAILKRRSSNTDAEALARALNAAHVRFDEGCCLPDKSERNALLIVAPAS